jgi:mitochondrial cardiolipin hydrolase
MNQNEIKTTLTQTFEDFRLSKGEKYALAEVFSGIADDPEALKFARNRAFDLLEEHFRVSHDHHSESLRWLEQIVKLLDQANESQAVPRTAAYFSPGHECAGRIMALSKAAQKSIDVCVFTIADDNISDELRAAHKRGIRVRIITDDDKSKDRGSDVRSFVRAGIEVKMDNSPHHMHHKFAVFDGSQLVNGSFNWTRSASHNNQENIVVTDDTHLVAEFQRAFEGLWQQTRRAR